MPLRSDFLPEAPDDSSRSSGNTFTTIITDLRYAFRQLRTNPGFTAVSVLTLALGIGASAAIFSAVNPILFETLPYPHAKQVVMVWEMRRDGGRNNGTFGAYRSLVDRNRSFEAVAVTKAWKPTLTGAVQPERFEGQQVSAGYFRVLGVPPAMGRDFQDSDDQINGPKVAILSNALWLRRFGADTAILGQVVRLDDNSYTVIGVMPPTFENVLVPTAEIWSPLQYDRSLPANGREWGHHLRTLARLLPNVSVEQASHDLEGVLQSLIQTYPAVRFPQRLMINPLQNEITGAVRPALLATLGAVILVLIIACVNVTNLLLARGAQRSGEFAVRSALGAGRPRLLRQLLTESLLLALIGGTLGMLLAEFGVRILVALSPPMLPRIGAIRLNGTVLAFGIGMTTLIGLLVGLVPAIYASRGNLQQTMQQNSQRTTGGHQFTRRLLVVVEFALALALLVSAGLLMRSLQRLFSISPGFNISRMLTLQVQTSSRKYDKDGSIRFFNQAVDAVRQVPGVSAAALTSQLPLSGDLDEYGVQFESLQNGKTEGGYSAFRYAVSPEYLETIGIPLLRGRLLNAQDTSTAPLAVVLSESLARHKFPNSEDPIGRRLHVGPADGPWYVVVGVVGNVKQASLALNESDAVYVTLEQWRFADPALSLIVRSRSDDLTSLVAPIKNAIWSADKDQPIARVATMDNLLAATAAERRFAMVLFEAFGFVALLLAATGIYGVLSGSVTERMREIGVRLALGATPGNILSLVVRQGVALTGLGIVIGLSAAVLASQAITSLLFGVSRLDPVTYIGVVLILVAVSVIACWVPAQRAARVDPSITLRAE